MIYNEDAYYTGYYRNVRALGAIPALVFDTICGLIRDNGIGEIANSTILEFLGVKSKNTLNDAIAKLVTVGYIEKKSGDGRGNKCIYYLTEKGSKNAPFMGQKGVNFCPKRGQNLTEKGSKNDPINKELNKELNKESGSELREAQSPTLSETPPLNFENMEDFNEFWSLYPGDPKWSHEREACERAWYATQPSWRDNLIQQLRQGKRWRPIDKHNDARNNPIFYIKNYSGETVPIELPYLRQGSKQFTNWLNESTRMGRKIILMRYDTGDPNNTLAYCFSTDRAMMEAAGATYIRDFN